MIKFIITGNPISSKNSIRSGITKDGRNYTYTVKAVKDYRDNALGQLKEQIFGGMCSNNEYIKFVYTDNGEAQPIPITDFIEVSFIFYCIDGRKRDLCNLIQAPSDLLQEVGIILNDYLIRSLDGSRIVGVDRENPRTIIELEVLNG
jgi:Holliday junction resolvase RusA-like endonuclease